MDVLARFHKADIKKVGLDSYGKHGGFYQRQLDLWTVLARDQARVKDVDSGEEVGMPNRFDDMIAWLRRNIVKDEVTLMHGDYKVGLVSTELIFTFQNNKPIINLFL